ncbi:hypothetical protein D7V19_24520 [Vibrio parahaemolyticus]|nr:hypothetical protein [Vibrio parahaemolyticus]
MELVSGEFNWLKVWQGQVNWSFRACFKFAVLGFLGSKPTLLLKVFISWLLKPWLKHSGFYGS